MSAVILILAAGRSTRFGTDKRLAKLPEGDA
jgi:CTP:molybdopterin cytidylyltransferase MocA